MYYPFSLEEGRSIHIEKTPSGTYSIWESIRVEKELTRDEAVKICESLLRPKEQVNEYYKHMKIHGE